MLERIHVRYELWIDPDADRDVIERVHAFHAEHCPVARSIAGAIEVSTELSLLPADGSAG